MRVGVCQFFNVDGERLGYVFYAFCLLAINSLAFLKVLLLMRGPTLYVTACVVPLVLCSTLFFFALLPLFLHACGSTIIVVCSIAPL